MKRRFRSLDICAGAGGQALGLEQAGFDPTLLLDNDPHACTSLFLNRPQWDIAEMDLRDFVGHEHPQVLNIDLLAGGLPRIPYSVAGQQRQATSERNDLLKATIWLATEVHPRAIMLENVPHLVKSPKFTELRDFVEEELKHCGYVCDWSILDAQHFGVPQRREHGILVAMKPGDMDRFSWPVHTTEAQTVGEVLLSSMASRGWQEAHRWSLLANEVAPTIVGGSKDRGGADLGPSRTKKIWARLGVNGSSIGDDVPGSDFVMRPGEGTHGHRGLPKMTVEQVALLQGFPTDWQFAGRKTARYRQVGQAFPPPLAAALGKSIRTALDH
jgi:DNA (cytosine-5)-methyltransferase 1